MGKLCTRFENMTMGISHSVTWALVRSGRYWASNSSWKCSLGLRSSNDVVLGGLVHSLHSKSSQRCSGKWGLDFLQAIWLVPHQLSFFQHLLFFSKHFEAFYDAQFVPISLLIPGKGNFRPTRHSRQLCGFNFVVTALGRTIYGCVGQGCTYICPSNHLKWDFFLIQFKMRLHFLSVIQGFLPPFQRHVL